MSKRNQSLDYSLKQPSNPSEFITPFLCYYNAFNNGLPCNLIKPMEISFQKNGKPKKLKKQKQNFCVNPILVTIQQNNFQVFENMKIPQVQKIRILPNAMPIPGGSVSVSRRELPIPQISPQRKKSQCTKPKTSEPGALKHKTFEVGQNSLAIYLPDNSDEDKKFAQLCHNYTVQINPCQMGFIPHKYFLNQYYSFGSIVGDYFQKKNNPNCRFLHKLYNAIKLGEMYPEYLPYVGVSWISNEVLQVSKYRFARLLGIKTVDGSLFHRQGNFRSFGFVELTSEEIIQEFGVQKLESLDLEVEKLLKHEEGIFIRNGDIEKILEMCKWVSTKVRS